MIKNRQLAILIAAILIGIIFGGRIINLILGFALTGVIPGTYIVIPYWVMMLAYCSAISAIATPYVERILRVIHATTDQKAKTKLPRRRYTSLPS